MSKVFGLILVCTACLFTSCSYFSNSEEPSFEVLMSGIESQSGLKSVSTQIREARLEKGIPRNILAREIGLNENQLMNIEKGTASPTREIMMDIQTKLDIEIVIQD